MALHLDFYSTMSRTDFFSVNEHRHWPWYKRFCLFLTDRHSLLISKTTVFPIYTHDERTQERFCRQLYMPCNSCSRLSSSSSSSSLSSPPGALSLFITVGFFVTTCLALNRLSFMSCISSIFCHRELYGEKKRVVEILEGNSRVSATYMSSVASLMSRSTSRSMSSVASSFSDI